MSVRVCRCMAVLTLVLLSLSCSRLPELMPGDEQLAVERLSNTGSVPSQWGSLISVTTQKDWSSFQLWFQDEEGNARMVLYDPWNRQLISEVTLITRQ